MFLADRKGKRDGKITPRWHVGVDLFANVGDPVVACEDGRIVNFSYFYPAKSGQKTYKLLVEHSKVVVNYGEITSNSLTVIAPHGGDIEPGSSELAEDVHFLLTCELKIPSFWACKGFDGPTGAFDRWHITSTDIHEASFPLLREVIFRDFRHAIAFHGYEPESNQPDILVGGTSPLQQEICKAIENAVAGSDITVRLSTAADEFNGDSRQNIVNRLTADRAGGVQLEMSLRVRTDRDLSRFRLAIAQAVAQVYATRLRRFEGCRRRIRIFFFADIEIVDPVCVMRSIPFDPEQVICAIAAARGRPPRLRSLGS